MQSTVDDPLSPLPEPPFPKKTTSGSSHSSVNSGVDASIGSRVASDGDNRSSSTNISPHDLQPFAHQFAVPHHNQGTRARNPPARDCKLMCKRLYGEEEQDLVKTLHTTNPTIWVAIAPDSLTGDLAHECATAIQALAQRRQIIDIDIAFRESEVNLLAGPPLLPPATDVDPLAHVNDALSTALSLPVAGLGTDMQGNLGAYFVVGKELYAFTARHVLFSHNGPNYEYSYPPYPKKKVLLMGQRAFKEYAAFVREKINTMELLVLAWTKHVHAMETRGDTSDRGVQKLADKRRQLAAFQVELVALKHFLQHDIPRWREQKNRVIGHVVWAPPMARDPESGYTCDVCVIKIDKRKFKNLSGNVLSLGREIAPQEFIRRMIASTFASFIYPEDGLLPARHTTHSRRHQLPEDSLPRFLSAVRHYSISGSFDTDEVAILPDSAALTDPAAHSDPSFSRGGDSGSIVVDDLGHYVGMLTSGVGAADTSDITYATPMDWVWKVIKRLLPDAKLDFDPASFMVA
ncbi:uncharacterized protein SCHCODRAFT_02560320 [Schizophyllum commune H4-8]|uniref:uncharacterized protein n=1 Tax=Schizophyllum commune (strain H4-8 / FGSC 9210) TaxID=578458 RepID=UPI0021604716|nr:uncharacterized protein SCHCODRAFT_02560320 [Schizophyllum commune H4-8]KAI5899330.1 hypothetical protein SCHCODRAFT_02560320 [Schizophyllum commune H4-8]